MPGDFERFYRDHFPAVRAFCTRRLRNPSEAEEVAQEAFLSLSRSWGRYKPTRALAFQSAKFAMGSHWAKRRIATYPILHDFGYRQRFRDPVGRHLREALRALKGPQREAVLMHFRDEMTVSEIARATGTRPQVADYRLKTGIRNLREAMA